MPAHTGYPVFGGPVGQPDPQLGYFRVGVDMVLTPEKKRQLLNMIVDLRIAETIGDPETCLAAWRDIRRFLGDA